MFTIVFHADTEKYYHIYKDITYLFHFNRCTASYHYHPLLVYNLTLPEEVTYDIIYDLINEYQLNIVNNMTQWIKDDTNILPNDLTTELPDTTTDSDISMNDISGIKSTIIVHKY